MKYDLIAEAYINSSIDIDSLPVADISHHHKPDNNLDESMNSWINSGRDYDNRYTSNKLKLLRTIAPYWKEKDPYEILAKAHDSAITEPRHSHAIHAYINGSLGEEDISTGSEIVNKHLIKSHIDKTEPNKFFSFGESGLDLNLNDLDEALKLNKLNAPLTTYSGIGFNPKKLMTEKGLLHLPAYTSSTTNKAVALRYTVPDSDGVHVLQITHHKGATGFYVGDNEDYSPFMQKEHIMPRGITLKINPVPEIHEDDEGNKLNVWKAKRLASLEK